MRKPWDVIVAGAGPAGSTAAAFLADEGHRVLVLEREYFPRFHIGESLLPLGVSVLERLRAGTPGHVFHYKRGAQFICEETHRTLEVRFDEAYPGPPRSAWQVERSEFDLLLRDRALSAGAEVRHGETVTDVRIDDDGVSVVTGSETSRGRFLIDATGQGRLMANRSRAVRPFRGFGIAASFQHFTGIDPDIMGTHGDIRVMMKPEGWGWIIPLPNRRLSVGIVTKNRGATAEMVERFVAGSPLVREWTEGASVSEPQLIGNYAFRNAVSHGPRFVCIGDAACFLDPVFSSGVSLALCSAERAAKAAGDALVAGKEGDPEIMAAVTDHMAPAYDAFGALIGRFYNTKLVNNVFLDPEPDDAIKRGIVSVLAGDVWRTDNPFQHMLGRYSRQDGWASADRD